MMSASSFDERLEIAASTLIAIHPNLSKSCVMKAGKNFYTKLVISETYKAEGHLAGGLALVVADKSALENGLLEQDYGLKEVIILMITKIPTCTCYPISCHLLYSYC